MSVFICSRVPSVRQGALHSTCAVLSCRRKKGMDGSQGLTRHVFRVIVHSKSKITFLKIGYKMKCLSLEKLER